MQKIYFFTNANHRVVGFCIDHTDDQDIDDADNDNDNGDSDNANDIISGGTWHRLGPIMRSLVTSCQPTFHLLHHSSNGTLRRLY